MRFHGTRDWFGRTSPWAPEMALEVKSGVLHFAFRAQKAALCDESLKRGEFVEGLWERDVAELFLAGPEGRYQEINLSPTGAWWSALFSGYRERMETVKFPLDLQAERADDRWEVSFSARTEDLHAWQGLKDPQRRASPTAILHGSEPAFFAWNWNPAREAEPDFHRRDLFKPLSWREEQLQWP